MISSTSNNPSLSQSAPESIGKVILAITYSHASFGSVPSNASCPSVTPSPSVSGSVGSVVFPAGSAGVNGSSTPVISSTSNNPSLSQSVIAVISSVISAIL